MAELHQSLKDVTGSAPQASPHLYGAVAIGRYVRFYRWDVQGKATLPMTESGIPFHIGRQCVTVQRLLDDVEKHGRA